MSLLVCVLGLACHVLYVLGLLAAFDRLSIIFNGGFVPLSKYVNNVARVKILMEV